jgi:hypothetical protein
MREGGAVTTNLLNDLLNLGVPQERANFYTQHYTAGHAVISVRADGREPEVANILSTDGATGFNDTLDDYYDKTMISNAPVNPTTANAYDSANAAAYNNPNAAYNDPNAATYNNPNAAYDTNTAIRNNPNAAYNDPNAAYDNTSAAAYNDPNATYNNPNAAYDNAAAYNDPNATYNNPNAATRNNPDAVAYSNPSASYNDPAATAYSNPNAAYDDPAYAGNRADLTDQDRRAMMSNEARRNPVMGDQQGNYEESRVDRNGNPRMQNNGDVWANNASERKVERDTRNDS